MSIELHTISNHADYRLKLYKFLEKVESLVRTAYLVPNKKTNVLEPHIGIGFLITQDPGLTAVIRAFGINSSNFATNDPRRVREQYYEQRIRSEVKKSFSTNAALQQALNGIMEDRYDEYVLYGDFVPQEQFQFSGANDDAQAKSVFNAIIGEYETRVDKWFGTQFLNTDSKERIALISMAYQGYVNEGRARALKVAILKDDRAEAWYQIRYNTNIEARRYLEADMFGLYNEDPSEDDYRAAYRMLNRHRPEIVGANGAVDADDQSLLNIAIDWGNRLGIPVKSIEENFSPASANLFGKYLTGNTLIHNCPTIAWDDIFVSEEKGGVNQGSDRNDLILGDVGTDNLYGEDGDDVI